jgi:uncharacterized protein with FMN-binding domain
MRKVITALIATAAGLAALLSFRSHSGNIGLGSTGSALTGAAGPQASASATTNPGNTGTGSGSGTATTAPPKGNSTTGPAPASKAKDGTYTGNSEDTQYGPVQVRATVSGGKLTDVTVLQVPDNGRYEDQIVTVAVPILRSEALSKQSANIDIVSGATFTSQGYSQSLQSALNQAGL